MRIDWLVVTKSSLSPAAPHPMARPAATSSSAPLNQRPRRVDQSCIICVPATALGRKESQLPHALPKRTKRPLLRQTRTLPQEGPLVRCVGLRNVHEPTSSFGRGNFTPSGIQQACDPDLAPKPGLLAEPRQTGVERQVSISEHVTRRDPRDTVLRIELGRANETRHRPALGSS
jgi:hypothetical protein